MPRAGELAFVGRALGQRALGACYKMKATWLQSKTRPYFLTSPTHSFRSVSGLEGTTTKVLRVLWVLSYL